MQLMLRNNTVRTTKKNIDKPCGNQRDELSSEEYGDVYRALSEKKKPSSILRYLMNKFESYRQKRKIGWSRPQNKVHVNTFESFYLRPNLDLDLIDAMKKIIEKPVILAGSECQSQFLNIIKDPGLMGFMFIQDYDDGQVQKEIITVSLGRKCKNNRRYRDRVDFLFESKVLNGFAQGLNELKIFVDPFDPARLDSPLWHGEFQAASNPEITVAYEKTLRKYYEIRQENSRRWDHWTQDYIDYFGPRKRSISNSFVTQVGVARQ